MYLTFEESFAEISIFLQKGLEGVVCHSNFAHVKAASLTQTGLLF
jgi:hypothetical protein